MVLKERENGRHKNVKGEYGNYAFHVHGDYSTEWINCIKARPSMEKYFIATSLLPDTEQEIKKSYMLLGKKG